MRIKPQAPRTLAEAVTRGLTRAGIIMAFVAFTVGMLALITPEPTMEWGTNPDSFPTHTLGNSPEEKLERLVEKNECWTDDNAPENVIPGHAIVTPEGKEMPRLVKSDVGFAIWQDGAPGTLHAFCP